LKGAWFGDSTLDTYEVKTWFQNLLLQIQLVYRYNRVTIINNAAAAVDSFVAAGGYGGGGGGGGGMRGGGGGSMLSRPPATAPSAAEGSFSVGSMKNPRGSFGGGGRSSLTSRGSQPGGAGGKYQPRAQTSDGGRGAVTRLPAPGKPESRVDWGPNSFARSGV
jgi:hypothetical protein